MRGICTRWSLGTKASTYDMRMSGKRGQLGRGPAHRETQIRAPGRLPKEPRYPRRLFLMAGMAVLEAERNTHRDAQIKAFSLSRVGRVQGFQNLCLEFLQSHCPQREPLYEPCAKAEQDFVKSGGRPAVSPHPLPRRQHAARHGSLWSPSDTSSTFRTLGKLSVYIARAKGAHRPSS